MRNLKLPIGCDFHMTKNEKRIFCVMNHDNYHCLINNNRCKKACRRMDLCKQSVLEEEAWIKTEKEMNTNDSAN